MSADRETTLGLGHAVGMIAVAACCFVLNAGIATVHATTFTVDAFLDAPDASPGDQLCMTAAGDCTLRAAVQEAHFSPGPDDIVLPDGTYSLSVVGADEDASSSGDLDVMNVEGVTIQGSRADRVTVDGNGVDRVFHFLSGGVLTLRGLTIRGGLVADDLYGGGILNEGTTTVIDCEIEDNVANFMDIAGFGGGIANLGTGTLEVVDSALVRNHAGSDASAAYLEFGGGLYQQSGLSTLTNVTIGGNVSGSFGGGINVDDGTMNLRNVTISQNEAVSSGGGINQGVGVFGATMNIRNSIVSDNHADSSDDDCSASLTSEGYNLIKTTSNCTISGDLTGVQTGVSAALGPLGDYGGGTETFPVTGTSPANGTGNLAAPGSGGFACPSRDQRGYPRVFGGPVCDLGAYEFGPCGAEPRDTCKQVTAPLKASLLVADDASDAKDKVKWKWTRGEATTDAEFGDGTNDYALCVYDASGIVLQARAPGWATCRGGRSCWTDSPTGIRYSDRYAYYGIRKLKGRQGVVSGLAKLAVLGKGPALDLMSLPWTGAVTAQAEASGVGTCWTSVMTDVREHTAARFKAKGQ